VSLIILSARQYGGIRMSSLVVFMVECQEDQDIFLPVIVIRETEWRNIDFPCLFPGVPHRLSDPGIPDFFIICAFNRSFQERPGRLGSNVGSILLAGMKGINRRENEMAPSYNILELH